MRTEKINTRLTCLLLCVLPVVGLASEDPRPGRLPAGVTPVHYEIRVEPDAQTLSFAGAATIDVEVARETREIALNALDLEIESANLDGRPVPRVVLDPVAQVVRLGFDTPVAEGRHRLEFVYRGRIYTNATGLFAVDYDTPDGPRRMLTTQFEATDGRRFAPMWDEPAAKATFALEVVVPSGQSAYSNMPAERVLEEGGRQRIRFAASPRMSSYLLHLSVGELERISRKVAGVDVGVVARKGAADSGRYALEAAAELLPWFNEYFATPYPLPKLDMIAVPGSSQFFGAMENWGAIMYFERLLLVDPRFSSASDRRDVFSVVAHEMAHQWFGDLVTMDWWDDLWLNEGYASWMAIKAESVLHPDWETALMAVRGSRERAMRIDADPTTHPIVQPIHSVDAISQAFDTIAYSKGSAVIRMLEETLGERGFRDGIRRYMARYAYGNASTDQLWAELSAATGRPVTDIAHDFTLQPGVPLVSAQTSDCVDGRTPVTLSQGRLETGPKDPRPVTWRIPVRLRSVRTGRTAEVLLGKDGATVEVDGCGAVVVNAGQAGYFRTRYASADLAAMSDDFAAIDDVDRLGVLNDTWALAEVGEVPVGGYLKLAGTVGPDANPLILMQAADTFGRIDRLFGDFEGNGAWRAFARDGLEPALRQVGWTARPGEPENVALLREELIETLGQLGDEAVIAEARSRFARAPQAPEALPASIRASVLRVVARHADAATWSEILARAKSEPEPIQKRRYFAALGRPADPVLAERALKASLSGEIPPAYAAQVISVVSIEHPGLAFDFGVANETAVLDLIEASSRWAYLPSLADGSYDRSLAVKVRDYAERSIPREARKTADEVVARIDSRAAVRARVVPEIFAWLNRRTAVGG